MMCAERGGFVASSGDTQIHFIDLDLQAEALRGVLAGGDKAGYESLDLPTTSIHGENDAKVPVQVPERVNPLLASALGIPKDLVPQR